MFFFRPLKTLRRLAGLLVLVLLVAFGSLGFLNFQSSRVHDTAVSDAIVVMGAAQFDGKPSPLYANRLNHALALYRSGVSKHIVTVGGSQPGDRFTEAAAGRRYLLGKGVPASSVLAVEAGSNSWNSLQAVAASLSPPSTYRITLVSDRVHMARIYDMANVLGFKRVYRNSATTGAGSSYGIGRVLHECVGDAWFHIGQRWLQ